MIVYKFGGASVKSADGVKGLTHIIKSVNSPLVLVVSAMGKTTNALENLTRSYFRKDSRIAEILNEIQKFHYDICKELFADQFSNLKPEVDEIFFDLIEKLHRPVSMNYDFEYDQIVSYGEIISTRIISIYLNHIGVKNEWVDVRSFIKTDNTYREAGINWELSGQMTKVVLDFSKCNIYVTQGFIGSTSENFSTTLGREGSDYTASIISYILDAEKMVVWKDVPGILNADPRLFPDARKLDQISYLEAIELTYYGAQVIHPKTMKPLQNKNIPLFVKSFIEPTAQGTIICNVNEPVDLVPIIILKKEQVLISINPSDFSFIIEENLSDIFSLFARNRVKVNLSQTSALSFSVCVDAVENKYLIVIEELKKHFRVKYNEGVELITIRHYDEPTIHRMVDAKEILVEQKSRRTARFVVK